MAWYNIEYKCGCTRREQLYGKIADRENRITKAEKELCPECWKKQLAEKAQSESTELALPALEGSEKQVAWANQIRLAYIKDQEQVKGMLAFMQSIEGPAEQKAQALAVLDKIANWLTLDATNTSAKYWIDNRNKLSTNSDAGTYDEYNYFARCMRAFKNK